MKHEKFNPVSIEDKPEVMNDLMKFAQQLSNEPTLSAYLNDIMRKKHLTAPAVYHRAELDRQVYNKIIQYNRPQQKARRRTLLQIAIGVHASEREATELLACCGYTFQLSSVEDKAFLFCIRNGFYDMYHVYEAMSIIAKATKCEMELLR